MTVIAKWQGGERAIGTGTDALELLVDVSGSHSELQRNFSEATAKIAADLSAMSTDIQISKERLDNQAAFLRAQSTAGSSASNPTMAAAAALLLSSSTSAAAVPTTTTSSSSSSQSQANPDKHASPVTPPQPVASATPVGVTVIIEAGSVDNATYITITSTVYVPVNAPVCQIAFGTQFSSPPVVMCYELTALNKNPRVIEKPTASSYKVVTTGLQPGDVVRIAAQVAGY